MTTNDEYGQALSNLDAAEKLQEMMKTANAIIRSKKNVTERLINEAGLSESNAIQIQQKDFAGRIGFPTFKLTNNNANISRLRERVNMLSDKLESSQKGNETYTFSDVGGGGTIEINYDIDRVQLLFSNGRVDNEVYKLLRKNGYVYSPTNKAFQRKITPQAISNAIYLTKATRGEVAEQRDASLSNLTDADRQNMLENKKFSYVRGNLYGALPPSFKEYTGAKTFELVYFSTIRENVKDAIKRYFKEHIPIVDLEKLTINVYTQTYIRESKLLYKQGDYMPSNTEPNVLMRLKKQLDSYQNMSDRVDEEEPKETIETIEPNSSDEFDEIIMANIDPHDDWIGNLMKERDVKQQIYKQLSGDEQEKEAETNRIFYLYAEKNKNNRELPKMSDKNIEEIYSSFTDEYMEQIIDNIKDEIYGNWQGNDTREREVKNSIWREINKIKIRQENKTNLLNAVYQKMYNEKEKINEISYLYDENTKELPKMSDKNIEEIERLKKEIGDVTILTDEQLAKYLYMLTIPDVARAIKNAENTKIAIENEIEKRKQSTSEKSDYQKELDRQVNEGEIEDDSQGISIYHLAKNIEETTNNQFKGVYGDYKNQYVLNKAIEELLMTKDSNYSSEEKVFIRKYSGYGGLQKFGKGGKGAFFEFYTPTEIIERMWGLAYKYGYDNGSVLETSVGTGEFFRYAPKDVRLVGYEISEYSGKICKILYPTAEINIQPFEKTFIKNNYTMKGRIDDLEKFSLVIGNPPYGDFSKVESRYMSGMGEKDYTHARNYVEYFIRRGMDLLESGGLLVFIIGASLKYGGTMFLDSDISPVKTWLSENCTLETAYRLPDSVFERTGVTADIIVLKKN